jgi:hypothetical protein
MTSWRGVPRAREDVVISCLLGVDAGSTMTKAVLFDLEGRELACERRRNMRLNLPFILPKNSTGNNLRKFRALSYKRETWIGRCLPDLSKGGRRATFRQNRTTLTSPSFDRST